MKTTNNLGLKKIELTDSPADITVQDANWDLIDKHLYSAVNYQKAGGTGTVITLSDVTLVDGFSKTFIVSLANAGAATTINGKPLYKPGTTAAPSITAGKAVTVWYSQTGDCFFIKASAEGDAVTANVLAGKKFSNDNDTGIVGTMPNYAGQIYGTDNASEEYEDLARPVRRLAIGSMVKSHKARTIGSGESGWIPLLRFKPHVKGYIDENTSIDVPVANLLSQNIKLGVKVGGDNSTIIGTLDTRQLNFPLSIQDTTPTPVRAGHIWVKSATLGNQITKVKILEAVNAGETDGTLMLVVGDLALHSVSFGNTVDITGGGYKYTSISDVISSTADWDILKKTGDIDSSYKINRPMVYSKLSGILDIETTYYWDGTNWILLCEKDAYVISSRQSYYTAANGGLVLFYKIGNTIAQQAAYDGGGGRMITSRDGKYILSTGPVSAGNASSSSYQTFKLYKRDGDLLVPYHTLNALSYPAGYTYYKNAMMSADGQYLVIVWQTSSASWGHYVQILKNNGSVFEHVYSHTFVSTNSTNYSTAITMSTNGEFICVGAVSTSGGSWWEFHCYFKSGSSYVHKIAGPSNLNVGMDLYITLSYDEKNIILNAGLSSTSFFLQRWTIDYVNQTLSSATNIEVPSNALWFNNYPNASGFLLYFISVDAIYRAVKIVNNTHTIYSLVGFPTTTVYTITARFNIDTTLCYIWRDSTKLDIYGVVVDDVAKKLIFTLLSTYTHGTGIGYQTNIIQVVPS